MERLFFLRIGGTAMGGVAAACQALGDYVEGSEEQLYEPMKSYLARSSVTVRPTFDPQNLADAQPDRVVVGNAVVRGNEELEVALEQRMTLVSLPQLVHDRLIAKNTSVVISGTHGKTTTTSMTAWHLECAGLAPGFMIGGVPRNFGVSCRPSGFHNQPNGVFVIEGDEYDTAYFDKRSKFLWYRPDIAVINNIEFDHADIFESLDAITKSFRLFIRLIPRNGLLLIPDTDPNVAELVAGYDLAPMESFGTSDSATWRISDLRHQDGIAHFRLEYRGAFYGEFASHAPGEMNVRNMVASIAVAHRLGVSSESLVASCGSFRLPKRRLETIGTFQGATVIDDFAHHPTALTETIKTVRQAFPGRDIHVIFEPRSNSTTRNIFFSEFKQCFHGVRSVCFGALDRPTRYTAEERLDTEALAQHYESQGTHAFALPIEHSTDPKWGAYLLPKLKEWVKEGDVVLFGSNGNVGGLREMIVS